MPEVAMKLEVKQEVIYALARSGLLETVARQAGRRAEQRISAAGLDGFQRRFVFGRDVAEMLSRSPRSTAAFLASEGVVPVSGPGIDDCRQLVFRRDAVDDCLRRTGVARLPLNVCRRDRS